MYNLDEAYKLYTKAQKQVKKQTKEKYDILFIKYDKNTYYTVLPDDISLYTDYNSGAKLMSLFEFEVFCNKMIDNNKIVLLAG